MTGDSVNPFVYLFPIVLIVGFGGYYLYGAIDRLGLEVSSVDAVVTSKQFTAGGTTYNTNIAGGRAWTQANSTPDWYALQLKIGDELTVGLVTKEQFDRINEKDRLRVKVQRTRISGQLQVVEVGE